MTDAEWSRCHESLRTSSCFIGFEGWVPKLNFNITYQSGMRNVLWTGIAYGITRVFPPRIGRVYHFTLDTPMAKREIEEVAHANGWHFRGVPLSIEASAAGAALAERMPPVMRDRMDRVLSVPRSPRHSLPPSNRRGAFGSARAEEFRPASTGGNPK